MDVADGDADDSDSLSSPARKHVSAADVETCLLEVRCDVADAAVADKDATIIRASLLLEQQLLRVEDSATCII
jgi:hypothetical protein